MNEVKQQAIETLNRLHQENRINYNDYSIIFDALFENDVPAEEYVGAPKIPCADRTLAPAESEICATVKVIITDGIVSGVLANKEVDVEIINIDDDYEDYEALCQYEDNLRNDKTLQDYDFTVAHFEEKSE